LNTREKRKVKNLTFHLIDRGRITTSVTVAKTVQKKAERLISKAGRDTLANRRYAAKKLPAAGVKKLFELIGPANAQRKGGYTRIVRLPDPRKGDGRENCILEIIDV